LPRRRRTIRTIRRRRRRTLRTLITIRTIRIASQEEEGGQFFFWAILTLYKVLNHVKGDF
jgi:hypothetical protein